MRSVGAGGRVHRHREGHPRVRKVPYCLLQVLACCKSSPASRLLAPPCRAVLRATSIMFSRVPLLGRFLVSGFCLKSSGPVVPVHSPDLPCPLVSALGSAAAASSPHTTLLHCSTAPQLHCTSPGCPSEVCRRVGRQPCTDIRFRRLSLHRTLHFCITAGMLLYQTHSIVPLLSSLHLCIFASLLSLTILPPCLPHSLS